MLIYILSRLVSVATKKVSLGRQRRKGANICLFFVTENREIRYYLKDAITNHAHRTWYDEAPSKGAKNPTEHSIVSRKYFMVLCNFSQRII